MIERRLEDVVVRIAEGDPTRLVADKRIVLLKESDGERLLPIWVGPPEGDALAFRLTGEMTPRPMTSDLMAEFVRVTGARVERVVVAIAVDGHVEELDSRPSDALAGGATRRADLRRGRRARPEFDAIW